MKKMKKTTCILLTFILILSLCSCGEKTALDPKDPVTLTLWHVYGEQADSPMNRLINEFNETVGKEKGIVINVTMMTNAMEVSGLLTSALNNDPGAPEMPDLFFAHTENVAKLGKEHIIDWNDYFTNEEQNQFIIDFVLDGVIDDTLAVLPISKSTHLLFVNGSEFERFSKDTGAAYDDLSSWEGLFDTAKKYYQWSEGTTFCVFDYLLRAIELNAIAKGDANFYGEDGWYDFTNKTLKESYLEFLTPLVQGYIGVSDMYSNTQIMTGETPSGIGSSAAILYYNDTVTYPDNTTEPVNLQLLPYPQQNSEEGLMTQAGVGLCGYKTTPQKGEAASVFAHWLTESQRNLDFVTETGYMPVCKESYQALEDYEFPNKERATLYSTLDSMKDDCTALSEPNAVGYYDKALSLYNTLREKQGEWKKRSEQGEALETLLQEAWDVFQNIQ